MNLLLILNVDVADPRLARVVASDDLAFNPLPTLTFGDTVDVTVRLVKNDGTASDLSGADGYAPRLTLGVPGFAPLVRVTEFAQVESPAGWTCSLPLTSDELALFLRNTVQGKARLQFSLDKDTGGRSTYCSLECPLSDAVEDDGDDSVTVLPRGTTPCPEITSLTGGTATDLDGFDHDQYQDGHVLILTVGGVGNQMFQKLNKAGVTDVDATPPTVRCKGYNPANPYIWEQIN